MRRASLIRTRPLFDHILSPALSTHRLGCLLSPLVSGSPTAHSCAAISLRHHPMTEASARFSRRLSLMAGRSVSGVAVVRLIQHALTSYSVARRRRCFPSALSQSFRSLAVQSLAV